MDLNALSEAGFEPLGAKRVKERNLALADSGLAAGGEYRIDHVLKREDVTITVEQNIGSHVQGDVEMTIKYPPVAVVESPRGRVACSPGDTELLLALANDLGA